MYALFGFAMYKVFEEGNDKRALIVYNWLVAVSLGVYNILFCVTHWIFAAKNWVIASQQEKVSMRLNNSERINYTVRIAYWVVLTCNVISPVLVMVSLALDLPNHPKFLHISFQVMILVQIFSCIVLFDACRRFFIFARKNPDHSVNILAMFCHVTAYILYITGLIYYYCTFIRDLDSAVNGSALERVFFIDQAVKQGLSVMS